MGTEEELSSGDYCRLNLSGMSPEAKTMTFWRFRTKYSVDDPGTLKGENDETYMNLYSPWVADYGLLSNQTYEGLLTIDRTPATLELNAPFQVKTRLYNAVGKRIGYVVMEAVDRPDLPVFKCYAAGLKRISPLEILAFLGRP